MGGAGERRADLVTSGVAEDGGDVGVRADDPDLVRVGAQRAVGVDLVEAEDLDRSGHRGGGAPDRLDVGLAAGEQEEPVPRELPESPRRPCVDTGAMALVTTTRDLG